MAGGWITINGTHVMVNGAGKIVAGPARLTGGGSKGSGGSGSAISEKQQTEALAALEKLKPLNKKNPDVVNTPLKLSPAEGIEADQVNVSITGDARDGGSHVNANVSDLYTTQMWVRKSGVRNTRTQQTQHKSRSDYPVAVMVNGKFFLVDGNHRAAAAKLLDIDKIEIRVLNM